mmetsp:Transcript_23164/g.28006  ORF Transcript_23164/g.28006 Transcript_23164/m.28006 type:complete len:151 (-) Transcript_23164:253-705(-)
MYSELPLTVATHHKVSTCADASTSDRCALTHSLQTSQIPGLPKQLNVPRRQQVEGHGIVTLAFRRKVWTRKFDVTLDCIASDVNTCGEGQASAIQVLSASWQRIQVPHMRITQHQSAMQWLTRYKTSHLPLYYQSVTTKTSSTSCLPPRP